MNEIDISPDKIVLAYSYLRNLVNEMPEIKDVNIPSSIASKLNTTNYYNKLLIAKRALIECEILELTQRLMQIIQILKNIGIPINNWDSLSDIDEFGESPNMDVASFFSSLFGSEFETGVVLNTNNGYKIYVPAHVDKDTNMTVYFPGAGNAGDNELTSYLNGNGSDQIVLIYAGGSMIESISNIRNHFGITTPINIVGFSAGTNKAVDFTTQCGRANIDVGNLVLIDPPNNATGFNWRVSELKETGANITLFNHADRNNFVGDMIRRNLPKDFSINFIEDINGGHVEVNERLINNGIIDAIVGDVELNLERNNNGNIIYRIFKDNEWVELTEEDFKNFMKNG